MNEPGSILYYFLSWKFNMSLVLFCFVINSQKILGIDIRSQVCNVKNIIETEAKNIYMTIHFPGLA